MDTFVATSRSGQQPAALRVRCGKLEAAWLIDAPGQAEAASAGAMMLVHVAGGAVSGHVMAEAHGGAPFDAVSLVLAGRLELHGGRGRPLACGAGDVLLWNSGQSGAFGVPVELKLLHLLLPRDWCRSRWPMLAVGDAPMLRAGARWALAMAGAAAHALWQQRAGLGTAEREAGAAALLDLVARPPTVDDARASPPPSRLEQVVALVDQHLADVDLGPTMLAQRLGLSVRTLQTLLARHQLTVNGLIRRRRLERCRAALVAAPADTRVCEIGMRHGLPDAAHFSRLFKQAYGMAPRDYRVHMDRQRAAGTPVA